MHFFDNRPRNANGQYEPNVESGLSPDAMAAAYGQQQEAAPIDERMQGQPSQLSMAIRRHRSQGGLKGGIDTEAPGGGVGVGGTTLRSLLPRLRELSAKVGK